MKTNNDVAATKEIKKAKEEAKVAKMVKKKANKESFKEKAYQEAMVAKKKKLRLCFKKVKPKMQWRGRKEWRLRAASKTGSRLLLQMLWKHSNLCKEKLLFCYDGNILIFMKRSSFSATMPMILENSWSGIKWQLIILN